MRAAGRSGVPTLAERGHHRLAVDCGLGPLRLRVDVMFAAPWTLIFGPSGSGKSSLLRAACGLLRCDGVEFDSLDANGSMMRITEPPHRRRLGYAPQQATLFTHLSVEENVGFSGHSAQVQEALALFELAAFAPRRPQELSGGERQRVNLARAFAVADARLLLLDEPFSGVDRSMRDVLLPRMQEWVRAKQIPVISVSHDVEEALLLGAEVVRLEQGAVVAQGTAADVLAGERTSILANLG